jgi:hypothetical protein
MCLLRKHTGPFNKAVIDSNEYFVHEAIFYFRGIIGHVRILFLNFSDCISHLHDRSCELLGSSDGAIEIVLQSLVRRKHLVTVAFNCPINAPILWCDFNGHVTSQRRYLPDS